jgi:anti-anti-sigma factor
MKFEVETLDETTVFTLKSERLDSTIAAELKSQIVMIANSDNEHLIIDLTDVQLADSSGISALLLGYRLYRDSNRQFTLCGIHQNIRKLLEITQLDKVFTIAETKEKALADVLSDEDEG